jgi:Outer membrane protein beta-barrel domain
MVLFEEKIQSKRQVCVFIGGGKYILTLSKSTSMKNKIVLCFGLMTLMFSAASAQKSIEFGIQAGAVLSSYKMTQENVSVSSDSRIGFNGGVFAAYHFTPNISFRPELNYTMLGGNLTQGGYTMKSTYSYLRLPLNVIYHMQEEQGLFVGAGPTLAYGLSGKNTASSGGQEESSDIHFGSGTNDDLKPFEVGLNFLAGYRLQQGIIFTLNYNFGLNNIANSQDPSSSGTFHNRFFGLTVGYAIH